MNPLLTRINVNPSMDKWLHAQKSVGCNDLSIPKLHRFHRWSLGIDKSVHSTIYNGCSYLSMLGLTLVHVSKVVPAIKKNSAEQVVRYIMLFNISGFWWFPTFPSIIIENDQQDLAAVLVYVFGIWWSGKWSSLVGQLRLRRNRCDNWTYIISKLRVSPGKCRTTATH